MSDFAQNYDGVINIVAAVAIIFYTLYMNFSEQNNGLRKRLLFLLILLGALCLSRGCNYIFNLGPVVDTANLVLAAVVPFSLFLLIELMMRRHAPRALKIFSMLSSSFLAIGILIFGANKYALISLMITYVVMFVSFSYVLIKNRNNGLHPNEQSLIKINIFVTIAIIPLIVTDFKKVLGIDTIRLGAFGILFFLYALIKVWESIDAKGGFLRLVYLLCFNLVSTAIICYLFDMFQFYFHLSILLIMFRMLSEILIYTRDSYDKKAQDLAFSVMELFVEGDLKLEAVKNKISGSGFFLMSKKDMNYYNVDRILSAFKVGGLYFKSDVDTLTNDSDIKDEVLNIYEEYECNACIFVKTGADDFFLIFFKWPNLAPRKKLKKEFLLIQGLASQIKE